jgi:hypothetical protein
MFVDLGSVARSDHATEPGRHPGAHALAAIEDHARHAAREAHPAPVPPSPERVCH